MRSRVHLNHPRCNITLSASNTNTPPAIYQDKRLMISTAMMPNEPPNASDPVSPMNTLAG